MCENNRTGTHHTEKDLYLIYPVSSSPLIALILFGSSLFRRLFVFPVVLLWESSSAVKMFLDRYRTAALGRAILPALCMIQLETNTFLSELPRQPTGAETDTNGMAAFI